MIKKICVLLNCSVKNDGRVKKMIRFYENYGEVDFFYVDGEDNDKNLFGKNVKLYSCKFQGSDSFLEKIQTSVFFWNNYNFFTQKAKDLNRNYDIIVANDLPTLKPAHMIASFCINPMVIYDSHEIYTETINQFYPKDRKGIKKIIFEILIVTSRYLGEKIEAHYAKKTDYFISVNESIARYFEKKYNINKVYSIKNCPVTKLVDKKNVPDVRKQYQLAENTILFLYQGVINQGRALELFIEAFKETPDNIHFFLIGYGSFQNYLEKMIVNLGIENRVHFLGLISNEELHNYTPAFDFGVNMGGGNLSKDFGLSNKLFEYIHARIPILCTTNPENREIFSKYNIGYLTDNTKADIISGILQLSKGKKTNEYKANCEKAAKEYCWEKEIETLETILHL